MEINVLAIIPARGGSKGIPRKNIKSMAGKPLIQHTIETAKSCKLIDKVVVSTDDTEIASVSQKLGVEVVLRPDELSKDNSLVIEAIRYTIAQIEEKQVSINYILLLEATSPLRTGTDVEQCVNALLGTDADSVATFSKSKISPNRLWSIAGDKLSSYIEGADPWLPRQKQPVSYELNGLVYGLSCKVLKANSTATSLLLGKIHPVITEHDVVDIDDEFDWYIVEKMIEADK